MAKRVNSVAEEAMIDLANRYFKRALCDVIFDAKALCERQEELIDRFEHTGVSLLPGLQGTFEAGNSFLTYNPVFRPGDQWQSLSDKLEACIGCQYELKIYDNKGGNLTVAVYKAEVKNKHLIVTKLYALVIESPVVISIRPTA